MPKGHILVVDDEKNIGTSLEGILTDEGYTVSKALDGPQALEMIKELPPDVVLLDIWMPGMDGIEVLKNIKEFERDLEVIIMSGHGTIETAVRALKLGASDFIEKPLSMDVLLSAVNRAFERRILNKEKIELKRELVKRYKLVGKSEQIERVRQLINEVSNGSFPVLVYGERGTGKELVARIIHDNGAKREKPFVKINCAAMNEEILEQEIFGINRENGNSTPKRGKLELAADGTVFFDGIDKLSKNVQKKLLDLIKTRKFARINGKKVFSMKFRILAASEKDISKAVQEDEFLPELQKEFTTSIYLPPLRERTEDIPDLVNCFIEDISEDYGRGLREIDDEAMAELMLYKWPNNVKELKNILERLAISVPTGKITDSDVRKILRGGSDVKSFDYDGYSYKEAKKKWEKEYVTNILKKNSWDLKKAAKEMGISKKTLDKKVKAFGLMRKKKKTASQVVYQKTLKTSVVLCGQGLHSGLKTGLILVPQPPDTGIIFANVSTGETVEANIDNVESTEHATSLKKGKSNVKTIEHIMAVLNIYGINNLLIKITDEVPIMDGSAVDFCELIEDGGIIEQEGTCEAIVIDREIVYGKVGKGSKYIKIEPYDGFAVKYIMDYPPPIGKQVAEFVSNGAETFKKEIAPARTFGFLKDVEYLEKKGLISGGRLNNVVLLDNEKVINTELRFKDEFARHKILDIIGDFYLLGRPIRGKITANLTGHSENIALLRKIKSLY
ncbi:MAG: UDP-3-O-[3-hydroxymyristoyl] N-acetylglucosamine deacetylase [Candidatus Schekmanbacteria bacterium]|nr:MAG: UDP-3-O-[3-hydroxymyristoyl] N-acetylglucosamine deacetylase [Candidatus Schekmanbacteria bacterium]